ncbi:uncharacterized protein (TIGR03083 family) [Nocardiopsis sp. Huas11]|uniref:maleylpyruvate isomerase N-terminal domain-containing protein n=1 Tax=Nocardiopsis sp. Huas11 TaxID=2183912 RepID=UPI000EB5092D|nr:maleylpyruvate isomerase N-terminal domain-containing protein [Nocardiopsis sp. Huas11]RKS08364.1 uncharacterized protein (TIGR03083 family) [Nocardiopsis sp. Huas11]
MDSASVYTRCQDRLLDLAAELTAEQLATPVPALPDWTVLQTYAHLAGVCADVVGGLVPPSDDTTTARQVAERAGDDLDAVCAEWRSQAPALLEVFARETRARYRLPALDVWHHENDIRGALGLGAQTLDADQLAHFTVGGLARGWAPDVPGVRVVAVDTGQEWLLGERADLELRAEAFELARAVTGRRSVRQIAAMDWKGDPSAVAHRLPTLPAPEVDLAV